MTDTPTTAENERELDKVWMDRLLRCGSRYARRMSDVTDRATVIRCTLPAPAHFVMVRHCVQCEQRTECNRRPEQAPCRMESTK